MCLQQLYTLAVTLYWHLGFVVAFAPSTFHEALHAQLLHLDKRAHFAHFPFNLHIAFKLSKAWAEKIPQHPATLAQNIVPCPLPAWAGQLHISHIPNSCLTSILQNFG